LGLHEPVAAVLQLLHPGDQELPPGGRLAGPEIRRAVGEVDVVVAGDEPLEHDALLGGSGHSWWRHPTPAGAATTSRRSPSEQVLPKRKGLPQNRCYRTTHRKGGPVTEPARREYAAVMRRRYEQADKRERGRLLDEYCRTTGCHRKAAIRRLRRAPGPVRRAGGRPAQYEPHELAPILKRAWL